jgi:hypothetical protein
VRESFPSAILNLREWEGFGDNDPDDPGGETAFGISRHYHPEMWIDGKPPTWEQAEAFYLKLWDTAGCDVLPFPMDCLHFDSTVNPGPGASMRFLHDSGEHADPLCRCVEYAHLRMRYYLAAIRKRPVSLKYLAGWIDRTLDFLERTVLTQWSLEGK